MDKFKEIVAQTREARKELLKEVQTDMETVSADTRMKIFINENIDVLAYKYRDKNLFDINREIYSYLHNNNINNFNTKEFDKHLRKYRIYEADYFFVRLYIVIAMISMYLMYADLLPTYISIYNHTTEDAVGHFLSILIMAGMVAAVLIFILCHSKRIRFHRIPSAKTLLDGAKHEQE